MSISTGISNKELERIAQEAYEGKSISVMLCSVGLTGYTQENSVEDWEIVEKSGSGYARFVDTIGIGSYSGTAGAYLMPSIDASFTASGSGYTYDRIVIFVNNSTYPHSVVTESPAVVLASGQTQTYRIVLSQDD